MPPQISREELAKVGKVIHPFKGFLVSPTDSRYTKWKDLASGGTHVLPYLTEEAQHGYRLAVLRAYNHVLAEHGVIPKEVDNVLLANLSREDIPFIEADEWEEKIGHDIRGLVKAAQAKLPESARYWLYLGLTSYDPINTSQSLGLRDFAMEAYIPAGIKFARTLIKRAREESDTVMMGRTHKQHATPTLAGHWLGEIVAGHMPSLENFYLSVDQLKGKISGFVGNRAAMKFLFDDYVSPEKLEEETLGLLHLEPDPMPGQVVHQCYYIPYFASMLALSGNLAKFTEDVRNFQQTEVGEIFEKKLSERVGSSTGAHKANPIGSENVSGHWRQILPRLLSVYEDLVTDFQRDLRDSSNRRYYNPEVPFMAHLMLERATKIAEGMTIRRERMAQNLGITKGLVIAEPLQLVMQLYCAQHGVEADTHDYVRRLSSDTVENNRNFTDVIQEDPMTKRVLDSLKPEKRKILLNPELYVGTAREDLRKQTEEWDGQLFNLEAEIAEHEEEVKYI